MQGNRRNMAAGTEDSKIVMPFMPRLFHLATVKIAIRLFSNIRFQFINILSSDFPFGYINGPHRQKAIHDTIKDKLDLIPQHLRNDVEQAVYGLGSEVSLWVVNHLYLQINIMKSWPICWRCDGTLDRIEMAKRIVLDKCFNIKARFEMACVYFLEKEIQLLWTEMDVSGETENYEPLSDNSMVKFWIQRLRDGSETPLMQSLLEQFDHDFGFLRLSQIVKLSLAYPSLQQKVWQKFHSSFDHTELDDLRFCLYGVDNKQEEKIIRKKHNLFNVCSILLHWPLQSMFIETVEKMWNYIDGKFFCALLLCIFDLRKDNKGYNYLELFVTIWDKSPNHLKEDANNSPFWREDFDSILIKMKRKRKLDKDEPATTTKKVKLSIA